MTTLHFFGFSDYDDGKMAHFETTEEIPINIFIDNYEDVKDIEEGLCLMNICGVSGDFDVFESEEAYLATEPTMAPISMIPAGTFSPNSDDDRFQPSPDIIFTGIVKSVKRNPLAAENAPNCCFIIDTLDLELSLYVRYEGNVSVGSVVQGTAWLFGNIVPCEADNA